MSQTGGNGGRTDERVPRRPGILILWDEHLAAVTARHNAAVGGVLAMADAIERVIRHVTAQDRVGFDALWPGVNLVLAELVEVEGTLRQAMWQAASEALRAWMEGAIAADREREGLFPISNMVWLAPSEAESAQDGEGDPAALCVESAPASAAPARGSDASDQNMGGSLLDRLRGWGTASASDGWV
jgi:hypothetical protein